VDFSKQAANGNYTVREGKVNPEETVGEFRHHSSVFNYRLREDAAVTFPLIYLNN
jgi:hypothetical protein